MTLTAPDGLHLTTSGLARLVAGAIAPHEQAALDTYLAAIEEDPSLVRLLNGKATSDSTGFGGTDLDTLTPYIIGTVVAVLGFIREQLVDAMKAETTDFLRNTWRKLARKAKLDASVTVPLDVIAALTNEQLEQVRMAAFTKARALKLPVPTATLLADAVVGQLVSPRS